MRRLGRFSQIAQKRALRVSGKNLVKYHLPENIKVNKNNYQPEYRSEWDDASHGITNYQWTYEYILFEERKYDWEHGIIWFANTSPIDIKNYDELLFDLEITRVDEGPTEIGIYELEGSVEILLFRQIFHLKQAVDLSCPLNIYVYSLLSKYEHSVASRIRHSCSS